jgi:hypothetical protein
MAEDEDGMVIEAGVLMRNEEIEQTCRNQSEVQIPPQVFFIKSSKMRNSLLAVRTDFLDEGEGMPWPGLPLLRASFNLDWGYAFVDVKADAEAKSKFEQPSCRFEDSATGDTWGYRLCPVDDCEIIKTLEELAHIRLKLSQPRGNAPRHVESQIFVVNL